MIDHMIRSILEVARTLLWKNVNTKHLSEKKTLCSIYHIDEDKFDNIEEIATKSVGEYGTGGMKTKIDAAKVCQLSGCIMSIANGLSIRPIKKISKENICTWFLPKISKLDARKKWIIGSVAPKGVLIIDNGAIQAIQNGKSLLPAGIKAVNGKFEKGDHIKVLDLNRKEYARGLSSFSSDEIFKIKSFSSSIYFLSAKAMSKSNLRIIILILFVIILR